MADDLRLEISADLNGDLNEKLKETDKNLDSIADTGKNFTNKLDSGITSITKKVEDLSIKTNKFNVSLTNVARTSKYVLAGLTASAGLAIKKYADFESGILKVQTISSKTFNDIKKSAEDLSIKYGISVKEITEGNYQLVSSMGDVAESQEILETTAKLSIAGFTDYASAMNGLVAVMNGYKMEAKDAGKVADILMTVQNKGVTTIDELQRSLSRVTGVAANVNVSFEDLSAAMATITSNKVETAEAVTSLRSAFSELAKEGTNASNNFKKATGESFKDFMKSHNITDAVLILEDYSKKTGKSLIDLFSSVEAGNAILNLAGTNMEKLKDSLDAIKKSSGTADESLSKLDEGADRAFSKLKEQANQAVREIGEALVPQVKELTEKISKIDWKGVFSEENINRIITIGKEIALVTGGIWALSTAIKAVDAILKTGAGIKILTSLIGSKLFKEVLVSAGSTAFSSLGITTPAVYGTGLTGLGSATVIGAGLGIGAVGTYYGNKAIESSLGDKSFLNNKSSKEKIEAINTELSKIDKQIKTIKESNDNFENVALSKSIEVLKKKQEELKKIREDLLNTKYSNDGYLTQARGTVIPEIKRNLENIESKNPIATSIDTSKIDAIQSLIQDYEDFSTKAPKIWELLGINEKDKLEEKVNFLKSSLKKAVEIGATKLIPKLKEEFDKAENELELKIKKIDLTKIKEELDTKLNSLDGNGVTSLGKQGIERDKVEYDILTEFIEKIKNNGLELDEITQKDIESKVENLKKKINLDKEEEITRKNFIERMNNLTEGLSALSSSFMSIGSMTGSQTMTGIGSILGNVASLGSAYKNIGNLKNISGMFSGAGGAFASGLAGLGTVATIATAGIGIVTTIGSMLGSRGKKKAAAIDAKNKENENKYAEQVKAMQRLTQALVQNSKTLKTFSVRMLEDISKNPTLLRIKNAEWNFGTVHNAMMQGKHFNDISALEKGSASYRKHFRKKHKDTYTAVTLSEKDLLKYMGFDKTELDLFDESEMRQLNEALKNIDHSDLRRATRRDLTKSNIEEWKKQIAEFVKQLDFLNKEKKELFRGTTLTSFVGLDYRAEKDLIAQYTEEFKQLGLVGEQYSETIKEMAKNNQVFVTSMQDVRASTIEGLANGTGGFITSMKGYFEKIRKNAVSVTYDVLFNDYDAYFNDVFKDISEKLVEIKKKGKLNFKGIFDGIDFKKLKMAEYAEKEAKKSLDVIKEELINSGVDLNIVSKLLPTSDFTERLNNLKSALSNAMNSGLSDNKFFSFTKTLGENLYESTKASLVKAFSESSLYQSLIKKFIKAEDFQGQIEKAGSFKEAFKYIQDSMKKFGYEMEAAGFGGFDAINKINTQDTQLGNAYYTDKQKDVTFNIYNTYQGDIYGIDDFESKNRKMWADCMKEWQSRPVAI